MINTVKGKPVANCFFLISFKNCLAGFRFVCVNLAKYSKNEFSNALFIDQLSVSLLVSLRTLFCTRLFLFVFIIGIIWEKAHLYRIILYQFLFPNHYVWPSTSGSIH